MKANPSPCKQCPFRKDSLPGYLGEDNYNPKRFLLQLDSPDLHPCHMAVDWNHYTEEEVNEASKCTGALQFMNNSLMIHRSREMAALQKTVGKNEDIMQFKRDFIEHHKDHKDR